MTLFGIIWLIAMAICFRKTKYLAFLVLISTTIQCSNVFVYGSVGIGPQVITSFIFVVRVLIERKFIISVYKSEFGRICTSVLLIVVVALVSSIVNGSIASNLLKLLQLCIYVACFLCMIGVGKSLTNIEIYSFVRGLTIVLLIIGFLQFGITSGIIPRMSIVKTLLYNDNNAGVVYFNHNNWKRFTSTYMEPSYYSGYIVGAFYYLIADQEHRKQNYILLILLFGQIIGTFSSTAYGAFAIMGVIYLIFSKEIRFKFRIALCAGVMFGIMMTVFRNVLDSVIFMKFDGESYAGRRTFINNSIEMFRQSPIIGNGYKSARGSSIIETFLAEEGVVGLLIYFIFIFLIVKYAWDNRKVIYIITSGIAVMSALVSQMIAVPDFDICTLWMWMNVLALSVFCKKSDGEFRMVSGTLITHEVKGECAVD